MNKLYLKYLIFILIIITVFILKVNKKSSIANENIFHINNTSEITKIFIADRSGQTITLKKKKKNRMVKKKLSNVKFIR